MTYHTEEQKKSSIEVMKPLIDGMYELFEWLQSDDGIDYFADKYSVGNTISKDAPFKTALIELLVLASNQGIDVKRLIQSSVLRFYFERHLQDNENDKLKYIFDDFLT